MKKHIVLAATLSSFLAPPAFAASCAELIAEVNSRLAASADSLNDEVTGEIIDLRDEGQDRSNAGDEAACQAKLEEALSLFTQ
jgi:hypothetical protein